MPRVVNARAEDLVKELFAGLTDEQKKAVVKPWDHPQPQDGQPEPGARQDDRGRLHEDPAGTGRADRQGDRRGRQGLEADHPRRHLGRQQDVREVRGRHLRRPGRGQVRLPVHRPPPDGPRATATAKTGDAFGGPIYYGHTPNGYSDKNVFKHQTAAVMKLYDALDPKQQAKAKAKLGGREEPGREGVARPTRGPEGAAGHPLRRPDGRPAGTRRAGDEGDPVAVPPAGRGRGGGDHQDRPAGWRRSTSRSTTRATKGPPTSAKKPWSFWRLDGPGFVWNFRVLPHVHTYVNIKAV